MKSALYTHRLGLSRALYEEFRARILDGTYAAGVALPSSRALAAERGVSRTTVTLAYEQLASDGYIETRQGASCRVALGAARSVGTKSEMAKAPCRLLSPLSAIGQRIAQLDLSVPHSSSLEDIDFVYGPLSGRDFPTLMWMNALRTVERQRRRRLEYEDPRGNLELRRALQAHLSQTRGLICSVDQLMILNGSQQALDLCARLLVDPGDAVVVENPGYRMAHHTFEAYGATLRFLDVDKHGAMTSQLNGLGSAKLVYVTPTHQFPLGSFLPIGRRRALLDWAVKQGTWVIEDDYDSEYRYAVRPEAMLKSLDTHDCVIHVGTFSKTLSPQLRLGYMVLPPALIATFAAAKRVTDRHAATGVQQALALLLEDGSYDRHMRRIRRKQQARQQTLINSLQQHLRNKVDIHGAASGLHLTVWFTSLPDYAEPSLIAAARRRHVRVYPITPLFHPSATSSLAQRGCGLVMGYASLELKEIEDGVKRLAEAFREVERSIGIDRSLDV